VATYDGIGNQPADFTRVRRARLRASQRMRASPPLIARVTLKRASRTLSNYSFSSKISAQASSVIKKSRHLDARAGAIVTIISTSAMRGVAYQRGARSTISARRQRRP